MSEVQKEKEIARILATVKHIRIESIIVDITSGKKSILERGDWCPSGLPENTIIPSIQVRKSYHINPSRFDALVKLIKTLAIDRKKAIVIFCSIFEPEMVVHGLIASLSGIPLKRLINQSLIHKDYLPFFHGCQKIVDLPIVFLRSRDVDYSLVIQNLELMKEWLKPSVLIVDSIKRFPLDEKYNSKTFDLDSAREVLKKIAVEYSLAVITIT